MPCLSWRQRRRICEHSRVARTADRSQRRPHANVVSEMPPDWHQPQSCWPTELYALREQRCGPGGQRRAVRRQRTILGGPPGPPEEEPDHITIVPERLRALFEARPLSAQKKFRISLCNSSRRSSLGEADSHDFSIRTRPQAIGRQ